MSQYVYVLINPALRGLLKIGRTSRSPEERAQELSTSTGVPQAFIVAYECIVSDGNAAEKLIHDELAREGYRINNSREFFEVPLKVAIKVIDRVCQSLPKTIDFIDNTQEEDEPEAFNFLELGLASLTGTDTVLQNYEQAKKYFEKAVLVRDIAAYQYLADIHLWGMGVKLNTVEAIRLLEEGGRRGNSHCFFKLWEIFSGWICPPLNIEIERNPSELHPTNADVAFGWYLDSLDIGDNSNGISTLDEIYCESYLKWTLSLPVDGKPLAGRHTQRLLQPKIDACRGAALKIKAGRAKGILIHELKEHGSGTHISFGPMMKLCPSASSTRL